MGKSKIGKRRKRDSGDEPPPLPSDTSDSEQYTVHDEDTRELDKYKIYKVPGYSRKYDENCKKTEYIVFLGHAEEDKPFSAKDRLDISSGLRKHCVSGVTHLKPINKYKIGVIFELPNSANVFLQNSKFFEELSLKASIPASDTEITGVITSVPTEMSNKKIFKLIDSCRNVIQVRRFMRRERESDGTVSFHPTQTVAVTFASTQLPGVRSAMHSE